MRINVNWPLCVCLCVCVCVCVCVWRVSAPEPYPKHERQRTNIWRCTIISALQMCHDPPFGTVRDNPISRGINGRPTAVEKADTWLFWLTSSESDKGCGTTLGGKLRGGDGCRRCPDRWGETVFCMLQGSLTALGALQNTQRFKWLIPQRAWEHKQNAVAVARDDGSQTVTRLRKNTELSNTTR